MIADPAITTEEIDVAHRYAEAARAGAWRAGSTRCRPIRASSRCSSRPRPSPAPPIGPRLAAIGWMHRRAGLQPPQAREGAAAIAECWPASAAATASLDQEARGRCGRAARHLRCIPGDDLRSLHDRALLAFGMAGAFRRSKLTALHVSDVEWSPTPVTNGAASGPS